MASPINKKELKGLRQKLRNNMPPAEKALWNQLRGSQLEGYKFRRQQSIGDFILDFYCPEAKLAIEIDGDSHFGDDNEINDFERQRKIELHGIKIIRFTNIEIHDSLEGVVANILKQPKE
ncbi:MAG: DUF559 domain-containing protein [Nitrospinaceae bacterium]|nr:endonuclease domain-containing protein [Nitrospinaceae bacterium]NIR57921.1 endonuclease domain-containing protein [Nitrospinaceae bacterium]NIS88379.1 endonuclease domain-containing protein [Nitrospinaceae bacterium]NIT85257.1 endonuclease domain-containing protein [Nitrospinaceae bacterium]NIU47410.1 endonuclease domain-containing protein [Nitrospinaceae bacterium]